MKKNNYHFIKGLAFAGFLTIGVQASFAQEQTRLTGTKTISYHHETKLPNFIRFDEEQDITQDKFVDWAAYALKLPATSTLKVYSIEKDALGFTHTRYQQYANGYPVEGTQVITHNLNGRLRSVNGDYFQNIRSSFSASLSEASALQHALKKVNAKVYRWENKAEEAQRRETDPNFTYYPKGELVVVHKKGTDYSASNFHLAYKFNIYAQEPLYRANVFVDAQTGEILDEKNLICTTDVVGTAVTKYSGTVTMTSDNYGTNEYRLRETGRGNGINTYNSANTNTRPQTDFTNTSSTWNVSGNDQAASDAHSGAEDTYDYYKTIHNRNSINGSGYALNSYMHYNPTSGSSTGYVNAFWDGTEMSYGDGEVSQGFLIMTALDVCGHEITHGLTSFTSKLNGGGTDEASALNEGNSDIFGTTIEWFARPNQHDWLMGADITCTTAGVQNHVGIRDMSNPKNLGQPNCYMGTNWDPNGECHNNNGPFIYWYYLLCQGGSGTNDIGNAWAVSGITMDEAKFIAFRGNTVYFTQTTTYADARTAMIEAATDLYGACSKELAATTNAWYAVGVGAAATNGVPTAAFSVDKTQSCSAPLAVQFSNASSGASTYAWNFGDGSSISTTAAPAHTYTASGTYAVQLVATGTCSGTSKDSILKTSYITVNGPPSVSSNTTGCSAKAFSLSANALGTATWQDGQGTVLATGPNYTTPVINTTTTYYVTSSIITTGTATATGGPALNTTLGAGGYLNSSHYLIFNATAGFVLQTVDLYATTASGTTSVPTVTLEDSTGAALASQTFTLTAGVKNTVTLNFHVKPGNNYRLVASGTNLNLYRNNAGATYPISIASVASVTGTDVTATAPAYYYWFYNWVVAPDVACASTATPVTITISAPAVTFNYTGTALCNTGTAITLNATPAGGTFSGTGVTGNQFNPNGLASNDYVLSYNYTDANNCSNSDTANVLVSAAACTASGINTVSYNNAITVYPNPAHTGISVHVSDNANSIAVTDLIGQTVIPEQKVVAQQIQNLDIANLADGVYFIKVTLTDNQSKTIRFIKN
jgi:Zn-dependent metalloprotease